MIFPYNNIPFYISPTHSFKLTFFQIKLIFPSTTKAKKKKNLSDEDLTRLVKHVTNCFLPYNTDVVIIINRMLF